MQQRNPLLLLLACALVLIFAALQIFADDNEDHNAFIQTNLVSDVPGLAQRTESRLVNAWGIDRSPMGPWWVNSAGKGLSFVFDGSGAPFPSMNPLVVSIPPPSATGFSVPTGIVFNSTKDFQMGGQPSVFLFANVNGTVSGWNPMVNATEAKIVINDSATASYLGLTLGQSAGANRLYVADFKGGAVNVYDKSFGDVSLASGAFQDSQVPAGFAPFNVQSIGDSIFVTWAMPNPTTHEQKGPGLGYVDEFTMDGVLVKRLEHGAWMNAPWGVTLAPPGFGELSMRLLVGQFGSGQIAVFERETGKFAGLMRGQNGSPVTIDGLWGLKFGNGGMAGPSTVLFFAAGIQDEMHGLFGVLTPGKLKLNDGRDQ